MTTAKPPARYGALLGGACGGGFALPSYTTTRDVTLDLSGHPFACKLRIEQSSTIEHGACDVEEPINDRA
jgi:hypothetical protein